MYNRFFQNRTKPRQINLKGTFFLSFYCIKDGGYCIKDGGYVAENKLNVFNKYSHLLFFC